MAAFAGFDVVRAELRASYTAELLPRCAAAGKGGGEEAPEERTLSSALGASTTVWALMEVCRLAGQGDEALAKLVASAPGLAR